MEVQDGAHSYLWEICGNFRTSGSYHVAMHNIEVQILAYWSSTVEVVLLGA